jgi:excisionase family DNA binding protein
MKRVFKVDEVCEQMSLSRSTVYKLIREGHLRTVKFGRSRRVTDDAITECIAKMENM